MASSSLTATTLVGAIDSFDGEAATSSAEVEARRLRVELNNKGSELDAVLNEAARMRAELKEMKSMLNAAEAGADAAGADENSLRKKLSQLVCENGLLKGEKDRHEALAAEAASDMKAKSSRAATEVERLEIEVGLLQEKAVRAFDLAADGDRAKAALGAMETKLSELRQERTELQVRVEGFAGCSRYNFHPFCWRF